MIRNAGGRALDALRSLVVLDNLLGLSAVLVVHHTDCGLTNVSNEAIRKWLKERTGPGSGHRHEIEGMEFGEIANKDFEASLKEDVELLRASPLLREGLVVKGFLFDLKTGKVEEKVA